MALLNVQIQVICIEVRFINRENLVEKSTLFDFNLITLIN